MLFGLFFGAGNLVFPVELGRSAGSNWPIATLGFLVTATGLPVLGIIASALSGSRNVREMASRVGARYALAFTCVLYLTIGPFFAIPRTATVSYEIGVADSVPPSARTWGLFAFSALFFAVTAAAALRPGRLVDWVGRYLTPLFVVLLGALIVVAVTRPMTHGPLQPAHGDYASGPFARGFLDGYNTMDALASLAFAIVVIDAVRRLGVSDGRRIAGEVAKSSVVSIVGMATIYTSLAFIGATSFGAVKDSTNGGTTLAAVSRHYFGSFGQVLIAAIVLVACLKTAIGLVTACGEMFAEMFAGVLAHRGWVLLFTAVSFAISNMGLESIIEWSAPVLMFLYPLAITHILLGLMSPWATRRPLVHRWAIGFVLVAAFFDFVKALPVELPGSSALIEFARAVLPGYELGFGWVAPGLLGFVIGLVVSRRSSRPGSD